MLKRVVFNGLKKIQGNVQNVKCAFKNTLVVVTLNVYVVHSFVMTALGIGTNFTKIKKASVY